MRTPLVVSLLTTIASAACGGGGGPAAPDDGLPLTGSVTAVFGTPPSFVPADVTIGVGGTVLWRVDAGSPVDHTVTSPDGAWASSARLDAGESFSVTFPQAGSFPYRCSIHPEMQGTVTVR